MASEPWAVACETLIDACERIRKTRDVIHAAHSCLPRDVSFRLSAIADDLLSAAEDLCEQQANDINNEMRTREMRREMKESDHAAK